MYHNLHRALVSAMTPPAPTHVAPGFVLRDGTALGLRPIAATDKPALAAFFAALSPQSRHRRFLTSKPAVSARELAYFTEIDHRRHVALVALDGADRFVGLTQYAGWPADPGAAELAIAIADDYQHRGLGTSLGRDLVERARANGLDRLTATTEARNLACQRLLRRLGFGITDRSDGLIELELAL